MGKLSELDTAISELRNAAAAINSVADTLAEMFSSAEVDEPAGPPAPVKPPHTLESVRAVLAKKSRAGHTAQIRSLLQKYGADRLSGIDPKHYAALLADVEGLADAT